MGGVLQGYYHKIIYISREREREKVCGRIFSFKYVLSNRVDTLCQPILVLVHSSHLIFGWKEFGKALYVYMY